MSHIRKVSIQTGQVSCGNARHPHGQWHPADPLAASWKWRLRIRQWRNRKRWGCSCDA